KRGGGRRYYRPDDVGLLRGIRQLLYGQGYTIRGVQRILHERGPRFVVAAGNGAAAAAPRVAGNRMGDGHIEMAHPPEVELPEPELDDDPEMYEEDDESGAEPTLEPAAHPGGNGANGAAAHAPAPVAERLTEDEVGRLKATLSELLELKRLL